VRAAGTAQARQPDPHWGGLAMGAVGVVVLLEVLHDQPDPSLPWVLLAGLLLGAAFVWFDYGFTGGFRSLLTHGDGGVLAASFAVPAVAAAIIIPVATGSEMYGRYVAPIGVSLLVGAFMFGIGMQLSNGCGSGTLVAAGQGSRRMWITLPFFCLGGVVGGIMLPAALSLPSLGAIDLPGLLGRWAGLAATELLLAACALALMRGRLAPRAPTVAGGVIGLLAALMFLFSGEPWGITAALAVWGAKTVQAAGIGLGGTNFWSAGWGAELLAMPFLALPGTISNLGLLLGALLTAAATGTMRHRVPIGGRGAAAAVMGGLLMGIGARLSFGCNVGAFIGGLSSGSVHGLVWALAALAGSAVGIRLRPWAGLPN
jgi:hypothetical protein